MIDDEEVRQIQEKMEECLVALRALTPKVAQSRQAKKFILDQRKTLLAKYQLPHVKAGESSAAAAVLARGNPLYVAEVEKLEAAYLELLKVDVDWEYNTKKLESCRSMLALARETLNL